MTDLKLLEANRKAVKYKLYAIGLLVVILIFCINSFLAGQSKMDDVLTIQTLQNRVKMLETDKARADSLIQNQSEFISKHSCK